MQSFPKVHVHARTKDHRQATHDLEITGEIGLGEPHVAEPQRVTPPNGCGKSK